MYDDTMKIFEAIRPHWSILLGVSLMLSLSMGLRQSLGIFMPLITKDISISVADFTLAIAIQNLSWGILQPFFGALSSRIGFTKIMFAGAILYILGLFLLSQTNGLMGIVIGAGLLIGCSMACNGSAIAMSVASRSVPPTSRSMILGMVPAAGSLGALFAAPLGQLLNQSYGWRIGVLGFLSLALFMLPSVRMARKVDQIKLSEKNLLSLDESSAREALLKARRYLPFIVMTIAYFVCGMQLVFITTHLPSYLDICGMDPMLSAQSLGLIGGFNVLGSLFFGWAGGKFNKLFLLGLIYTARSCILAWYFIDLPTASSTLIFASLMGFLWLGVAPLVSGSVADMFGLRWQAMIQGIAFMSHQLGSFTGAFGGGIIYDTLGSYDLAWKCGVGLGLSAGITQMIIAVKSQIPSLEKINQI